MKETTKLKKAAKEVQYEIDMFNELSTSFNQNLNNFNRNVLTESFVVHAYCLFRFFYQGKIEIKNKSRHNRKADDIIAEDFDINKGRFRKNRTWEQAFAEDWRKTKSWQPGWEYNLE